MKKVFLYIICCFWGSVLLADMPQKTIYIIPFERADVERGVFYPALQAGLKKLGYTVHLTFDLKNLDDAAYIVSFNHVEDTILQDLQRYPKEKLALYILEPPVVTPRIYDKKIHDIFGTIFTWDDDLVDNKTYFKFYFPIWRPVTIRHEVPFEQKEKLCALMGTNHQLVHPQELYSERRKVINFFENLDTDEFDFYGRGWGTTYKNYRGYVDGHSWTTLKNYKFSICYENMRDIKGWVTEKIFDCFEAGCVPVYWGAENITDFIPKGCFIARQDFASIEQLYQLLKNMSQQEYQVYIDNIKRFTVTAQAWLHADINFIDIFARTLLPQYDRSLAFSANQLRILGAIDRFHEQLHTLH